MLPDVHHCPVRHVNIDPKTAERYFVTDGQKDIAACFDRRTSRVIAALKYDWVPNVRNVAEAWQKGGVLKIFKIYPDPKTGKYDYLGTKGQKIECLMAVCPRRPTIALKNQIKAARKGSSHVASATNL